MTMNTDLSVELMGPVLSIIQASDDIPGDYYKRKLEMLSYDRTWRIAYCSFQTIAFGV